MLIGVCMCMLIYMFAYWYERFKVYKVELAWRSSCVMDCHGTARGSISGGNGVKTEHRVLRKEQEMGVLSLSDLTVDGMLNTTNLVFLWSWRGAAVV